MSDPHRHRVELVLHDPHAVAPPSASVRRPPSMGGLLALALVALLGLATGRVLGVVLVTEASASPRGLWVDYEPVLTRTTLDADLPVDADLEPDDVLSEESESEGNDERTGMPSADVIEGAEPAPVDDHVPPPAPPAPVVPAPAAPSRDDDPDAGSPEEDSREDAGELDGSDGAVEEHHDQADHQEQDGVNDSPQPSAPPAEPDPADDHGSEDRRDPDDADPDDHEPSDD